MRLKEGFDFAYSFSGIITMVAELPMTPISSCVVQFVVFPHHRAWREREVATSSDEELDSELDMDSELQVITEVWVEPQYGTIAPKKPSIQHMNHKHYYELADVVSPTFVPEGSSRHI